MVPLNFESVFPKKFREKYFKFVAKGETLEVNGFTFNGFELEQKIEELKSKYSNGKEHDVLEIINCNLEEILIGDFNTLKDIVIKISRYDPLPDEFLKELKDVFNYDGLMSRQKTKSNITKKFGHALLELTEVRVCPYCNREFVNAVVSSEESSEKLAYRSPFDHFYPQSKYPMFSLSLANLIPCCTTCNSLKREKDPNEKKLKSVYELKNSKFIIFDYYPNELDFTDLKTAENSIEEIEVKSSEENVGNISLFLLKERYQFHKAEVAELLVKYKYLNKGKFKMDKKLLGEGIEDIYRLLFANYSREEDFRKRPLAKFTHDILSRIGWEQILKKLFCQ